MSAAVDPNDPVACLREMDGNPAFPSHGSMGEVTHEGMELRDYFAAKAMSAILQATFGNAPGAEDDRANAAYVQADAMLKRRQR